MHALTQKIATLRRQLAYRQYAAAACATVATLLAAALALGFADYVVRFRDLGLRIMATTALVAVAVWAAYRWWYGPRRQRLVPLAVARKVEAHFPQLNDSLASALEFLQQSEHDATAGSAQLRRLVVAEAETAVEGLPLHEVIDRRPLRRAAWWLVAVGLALLACLACDAGAVRVALARLVSPLGATQWPRQHHLAFRNPPTRLAAGDTFEAELVNTAGPLPDDVHVDYRLAHGGRRETITEPLVRVGDLMVAHRENVRQSFAYRARGGDDDLMKWQWVEVVEPPQLKSLTITVHPPAYTGFPPASAERHLDVLAGTSLELRGTASEPLSGARILQDGEQPVDATIASGDTGKSDSFHIAPGIWIAAKTGEYSLELSDAAGLAGTVRQWNLRTGPDAPPSVSWQSPSEDLYVTPSAVVPIALVVKDNLATRHVNLTYDRSDWSEAEREREARAARIELYRGPEKPIASNANAGASTARGESRVVEYAWNLAPLQLPVGAEISIAAEAADYRPGVGRTVGSRRITIIAPDELETRLAERLGQIVRQLERALAVERTTREEVRRVEIQQQETGSLVPGDRNTLQSAELNQRRVGRILVDPIEGVPALIEATRIDLEINHISESDAGNAVARLSAELDRMASGPLNTAEGELTTSRKLVDEAQSAGDAPDDRQRPLTDEHSKALAHSLTAAGIAQDDVITTLERLVSELSDKADYRRFARLLTELREDQLTHERATRAEIGLETLPLRLSDLSRDQRAKLTKASAGQNALAARFQKIEQGMDSLAQELTERKTDGAETLTEAVELARSLAIGAMMDETARDLAENRVGGALDRETQIAADLQQVINVLRGIADGQPEQLVDELKEAEERLEQLRQQLTELRQQIADVEKQAANAANPEQMQSLNKKQQELRRDINQLARRLDRLQAADASQSAQSAANRLDNTPPENQPPQNQQRPSPSTRVQKAEEDLDTAAQQLADRRQEAEDDLALEIVRRFQTQLTDMVERQKKVVEQTVALQGARAANEPLPEKDAERVAKLAGEERELADMAKEHSALLFGLGAVRVSLEDAERRLIASAKLLDERDTGPTAQRAERLALARLEGMMDAFAQTANDAQPPNQPPPANPGAGPGGEQPQRRPTFELLEVKMLRMLQVDLQDRTREYQQRLAGLDTPLDEGQRAELEREAQELAAEQGRLAELVENMLTRDNEDGQQ